MFYLLGIPGIGQAAQYIEFDSDFIQGNSQQEKVDISRFNYGMPISAGEYVADLYLNQQSLGQVAVQFVDVPEEHTAALCATETLLSALDVIDEVAEKEDLPTDKGCVLLQSLIPDAKIQFDLATLRLNLEVPQALVKQHPEGYIPPGRWQSGTPVAFVRYDASHYRYQYGDMNSQQTYLSIDSGVNILGWAIRHRGSQSWVAGVKTPYQSISTYAQHDVAALRAQLKIGDFYTDGSLLEGISMRGIQLTSDDRMLAPSLRNYAPVIRGVANSNARVTIRQNNTVLRELTVPAGAFEVNDLYPMGYAGDIEVEIQEANGEIRKFTVPYTSSAQLIRPGFARYNFSAGRYRDIERLYDTKIAQAVIQYGLTNNITLNIGGTYAKNYHAELAGIAFNTPIGAFSTNMTVSNATLYENTYRGYSLSANYNTQINPTDTHISLAAYRYSSRDYYRLADVIYANEITQLDWSTYRLDSNRSRPKNQLQVMISQPLQQGFGSLYITGTSYSYWNQESNYHQYQIGYSNSYKMINYSLSFSQSKNSLGENDSRVYLSLSMPLGRESNASISQSFSYNRDEGTSANTSLSGWLDKDGSLSYSAYFNKERESSSYGASGNYRSSIAQLGTSWSRNSQGYQQTSFNASGAIVGHRKGITLSNSLGDTFAIVHAKGARGAKVNGSNGNTIDFLGNGIVPYLEPYAINSVGIDVSEIGDTVELSSTNQAVIPRANNAMLIDFGGKSGRAVFFAITGSSNLPPLGTEVVDEQGQVVGIAAQGGQIYTRAIPSQGRFTIRWEDKKCVFNYRLPDDEQDDGRPLNIPVQCEE